MNSAKYYTKIKSKAQRLALKNRPLNREITHEEYEYKYNNAKKIKDGERNSFKKVLFFKPKKIDFNILDQEYRERYQANEEYWEMPIYAYQAPKIYGGGSLIIVLLNSLLLFSGVMKLKGFEIIIFLCFVLFSALHIAYYITMPKNKEHILDRLQGIITFPGYFWE